MREILSIRGPNPRSEFRLQSIAGSGCWRRDYLVPVDADPTSEAVVDLQMLNAHLVLRQMEGAARKRLPQQPVRRAWLGATYSGLAQMRAPEGTLVSFATQPGNVARAGTDGRSPYSKALARVMREPGLDIFDAFNAVRLAVLRETGGSQQPWVASSPIAGAFVSLGQILIQSGNKPYTESDRCWKTNGWALFQPVSFDGEKPRVGRA
jgi:hypothetical protein